MKQMVFLRKDPIPITYSELSERTGINVKTLRNRSPRCKDIKLHNEILCPVFSDKDLVPIRKIKRSCRSKGKNYEDKPKPSIAAWDERVRRKV